MPDPHGRSVRDTAGLTPLEMLRRLGSGPRGLLESQAEERLLQYGENTIAAQRPASWPVRFVGSLRDPFTTVLLCLGLVSAVVASWGTACVIAVLVAVSCALRSSGEYRADRSTAALRELVATTATVQRRSGAAASRSREIPVDQLVPGDVIRLGPGDLVPADLRLLRASGLTVRQAPLTGESAPVAKYPVDTPADPGTALFDQPYLCFLGSSVASGSGTAVVVATGEATQLAGTYREPARRRRESAFDRSVNGISWTLIRFMLLTPPLVLMADAALRGRGLETLPFAVAVAVGLTPEMLPVIVTTALARGAAGLAHGSEVIVKRLPALHDLGAIDVLCTDKTGTLTQDRPILDCHLDPEGRSDPEVLHWAAVNSLWTLQLADLPAPDALDEAILEATEDCGEELLAYDGVAALPFDAVRRSSCAVVRRPSRTGLHTLVVKGAVEDVLERCTRLRAGGRETELDAAALERLRRLAMDQAEDGLRLLAVALADRPARLGPYTSADEYGLTFVGFVGLRDALRPTAADALAVLARRGVAVKVLTGDHPGTAARVCRDLDLDPGEVVTAERIDGLTGAGLAELADRSTVFARCTPEHKARIVGALRERGHTTGFLGDGVNDLPALQAADVGICPRDAVDVARESADVVLAAKDLTAIDDAILAGRRSSGNIATYLRITLSSNLGNVISMLVAGLLLPFLPMLPVQVLVQNLCFDAAQLAFAFDRPGPAALRRPAELRPRDFLRFITGFGLLNAIADLATFGVLVLAVHGSGRPGGQASFHAGWFTENLLTQALVILVLRTGRRAAEGRAPTPVRLATTVLAMIGLLLPLSPLAPVLGMAALPPVYYLLLAAVLALYGAGLMAARARYEKRQEQWPQEPGR
ncbi:magnesium-translocating P-type ATPase [Streptomyces sp. H10-C2]|uniref:magnesium-translocating P-type ATPase n=1 Tax=unclassified Streptomyces TaxID=2593676 RepID=UPI0024B9CC86|nr:MULTISPECIES: magnesium-translocating P-type ATPase [unclassified Streptomyces]MDJ0346127.1 magnesium-translocating P-type ATPase [Streptomyces sp. PH10-H1]MDJ0371611.1 magnesium-translocating P-type ATPase [Streptomyces sp. H10-C2]